MWPVIKHKALVVRNYCLVNEQTCSIQGVQTDDNIYLLKITTSIFPDFFVEVHNPSFGIFFVWRDKLGRQCNDFLDAVCTKDEKRCATVMRVIERYIEENIPNRCENIIKNAYARGVKYNEAK